MDMIEGLPAILNKAQLHFVAQPILKRNGELFGHEILLRYKHYKAPDALLKIVRHLNLRQALDLDVCRVAGELVRLEGLAGCVNLNLFADSLLNEAVFMELTRLARRLAPQPLLLDMLELDKVQDLPHLRQLMGELEKEGVRYALDVADLNRPYSQFLPFDILRMDVRFTRREQWEHWLEQAQLRHVPLLAFRIENEQQMLALSELGVDYLQGFAVRGSQSLALSHAQL